MGIDVRRAREETPGCENVLHFNNAGAGLMPAVVRTAITGHVELESMIGGYEAHWREDESYQNTYRAIARLLNCKPENVALVENATRAWDNAFYGFRFEEGDRILTAQASYASNFLAMLQVADQTGAEIEVIPNDRSGQIDIDALENAIDGRTRLIALTHIPTNGGLVNPAEAVGTIAKRHGIPYLLDACQSAGQIPLDVAKIGCDFLSATGRKYLRGPRGTGFLYVNPGSLHLIEPPFIDLHAATWTSERAYEWMPGAARFENWEGYVAGKIALGVAVDYALSWGVEETWMRVKQLAATLREELVRIDGISVHDIGAQKGGIVTFSHARLSSADIKSWLSSLKINVTTSTPNYARLDAEARDLPETVRASLHYYNTEEEIGRFLLAIKSLTGTV